jgi:hypothetical protein
LKLDCALHGIGMEHTEKEGKVLPSNGELGGVELDEVGEEGLESEKGSQQQQPPANAERRAPSAERLFLSPPSYPLARTHEIQASRFIGEKIRDAPLVALPELGQPGAHGFARRFEERVGMPGRIGR